MRRAHRYYLFLLVFAASITAGRLTRGDDVTTSASPSSPKNVPDAARYEILRRGNLVEELGEGEGGGRSTAATLVAQALAVPPDDSHKWYLTLVVRDDDPASQRLRADFAQSDVLRAWGSESDADSPTHFQVRRANDPTQRDWLAPLEPVLAKYPLPLIVLQPPRSGQFGPSATVAKLFAGYDGDPKQMAARLRKGVITYCQAVAEKRLATRATLRLGEPVSKSEVGDRKSEGGSVLPPLTLVRSTEQRALDPPFEVLPRPVDPARPNGPQEWPPSVPEPLTLAQIQAACPTAPPEFLLAQLAKQPTSLEIVRLEWLVWQKEHVPPAPNPDSSTKPSCPVPPPNPTLPFQSLGDWKGFLLGVAVALLAVWYFQQRQKVRALQQQLATRTPASTPTSIPST